MREVPFLIVGAGRMAMHFCHYLTLLNIPFLRWSRTESRALLIEHLKNSTNIILLISDAAIAEFANNLKNIENKVLVHFSGSVTAQNVYSAHPLLTYSTQLYPLETYHSIPFILEENSPPLSILLPGLPNAQYFIPRAQKTFYHALCVMGGNFTCLLWQKLFHDFAHRLNLPAEVATPYLTQIFKNLRDNPHGALTGPLVRNDQKTIQANLQALKKDNFEIIYQAFVTVFTNLNQEKL